MLRGKALPWTLVLAVAASRGAVEPCSCDCCVVGLDRTPASGDALAECHVILATDDRFLSASHRTTCPETCARGENDDVLWTAATEVDHERYCAYECVPTKPASGASCAPGGKTSADGNGEPEEVVVPVALHMVRASGPATWPTVQDGAHEVGARTEDEQKAVRSTTDGAKMSSELAERIKVSALSAEPRVVAQTDLALEHATAASDTLRAAEAVVAGIPEQASLAAHSVLADTVSVLNEEAHETAEKEAKIAAAKLEKKMKAAIPDAKKKAAAPYMEAMGRAAAVAGDYQKAGDAESGVSFNENLQAGQLFGQAGQWQTLGEVSKAQGLLRDAHNLVSSAQAHAAASTKNYDTAASIMSSIGGYPAQAVQAEYHAEVMLNPDAPPPPPPLIK